MGSYVQVWDQYVSNHVQIWDQYVSNHVQVWDQPYQVVIKFLGLTLCL